MFSLYASLFAHLLTATAIAALADLLSGHVTADLITLHRTCSGRHAPSTHSLNTGSWPLLPVALLQASPQQPHWHHDHVQQQ
jgi:hypothetical protein